MAVTQYIGSRYVPIFADPAEWSSTKQYEPLTIVLHEGNSFTSKQFVPVGVDIDNTDYWAETGNYNAQVEQYRQEVLTFSETMTNKPFVFDTVADMQNFDGLYDGAYCYTNGFREIGVGGSMYKISENGVSNGIDVIKCGDFYAHLQKSKIMTPEQYGAYGDNFHDDLDAINTALANGNITLIFSNKTYMLHGSILVNSNTKLIGNGTTLRHDRPCRMFNKYRTDDSVELHNVIIEGFTIIGISGINRTYTDADWANNTYDCACVLSTNAHNIVVRDCTVRDFSYGIFLGGQYGENAVIERVSFYNCRSAIDTFCDNTRISDCAFVNTLYSIEIEPNGENQSKNTIIENCYGEGTEQSTFIVIFPTVDECVVNGCKCTNYGTGVSVRNENTEINNCDLNVLSIGVYLGNAGTTKMNNCRLSSFSTDASRTSIAIQGTGSETATLHISNCTIENFLDAFYACKLYASGITLLGFVYRLARSCSKEIVMNAITANETTGAFFPNITDDTKIAINGFTYVVNIPSSQLQKIRASSLQSLSMSNTQ